MKTRFVWLASLLLAVCLLSLMAGCEKQEQSVTAPAESVQVDQPDLSAPSEQAEKAGPTLADKAWWRGLSQTARNQAILERAWQDNGRNVGLNCKQWVTKVVLEASKAVVNLPRTLPDGNGWYFDTSPYTVSMSANIRNSQPGWIVQTNWKTASGGTTPHTLIVAGRGPTGVYVIESNWCSSANCNTVNTRFVPFTAFEGSTNPYRAPDVLRYTCYYVIGG